MPDVVDGVVEWTVSREVEEAEVGIGGGVTLP